jgi:thiol-disulfide isomerase/thioredoxin
LLNARIEPNPGADRIAVREWLGGRATVLAVWATWCPPCLVEKRPEALLSARLSTMGSNAQIRGLLAYDRARLADARARLETLGASDLTTARATEAAEQSLLWIFGFDRDRRSMQRTQSVFAQVSTALPFTLLLDRNGVLLGRITGMVSDNRGRSYWESPQTLDMLHRLGEQA